MDSSSAESERLESEQNRLAIKERERQAELKKKRLSQLKRMRFGSPSLLEDNVDESTLG